MARGKDSNIIVYLQRYVNRLEIKKRKNVVYPKQIDIFRLFSSRWKICGSNLRTQSR